MNNIKPEEPDESQPESEDLIDWVDRLYNESLQDKNRAPAKLEPDDKSADRPDPKNEK